MSNSPLVSYTKLSPNHSGRRNHVIDTISIHCMAGNGSVETCGALFADPARKASSNYGIGSDGRIALYVEEANRSWCTSNAANDHRAITIEVANNGGAPDWPVSDKAYAALLDLLTDLPEEWDQETAVAGRQSPDRPGGTTEYDSSPVVCRQGVPGRLSVQPPWPNCRRGQPAAGRRG